MNALELQQIISEHKLWLTKQGGHRANLCGADLCGADLCGADLCGADLCGANLCDANLCGANLCGANLCGADLCGANLCGANLCDANLCGAKNLSPLAAARLQVCPPEGSFIAWKACCNAIVKLEIPADAKRSNATSRKCRASHVKVLEVIGEDDYGVGIRDRHTIYRKGETVRCHEWDPDRWHECSGGIHFFMTPEEAEAWT